MDQWKSEDRRNNQEIENASIEISNLKDTEIRIFLKSQESIE